MIERVYQADGVAIYYGEAVDWPGDEQIDLVLTNPYGPMPHGHPKGLCQTPMLLHQWEYRKHEAERFAGIPQGSLELVANWNDSRECFWAANVDEVIPVDLSDFKPEPGGWYPLEVPFRLLQAYAKPGMTIWDGFMGRGTVARACREMGLNYVGVEQLRAHVDLALDYLELKAA